MANPTGKWQNPRRLPTDQVTLGKKEFCKEDKKDTRGRTTCKTPTMHIVGT